MNIKQAVFWADEIISRKLEELKHEIWEQITDVPVNEIVEVAKSLSVERFNIDLEAGRRHNMAQEMLKTLNEDYLDTINRNNLTDPHYLENIKVINGLRDQGLGIGAHIRASANKVKMDE